LENKQKTDMQVIGALFKKFPTLNKTVKRYDPSTNYKEVLLPIKVVVGDYCRDKFTCSFFDNEGGCPTCDLNIGYLSYDNKGRCPKPKKCLELKSM